MQDGKNNTGEKKRLSRKQIKEILDNFNIKLRDPEDNLKKAFASLPLEYKDQTEAILEQFIERASSVEKKEKRKIRYSRIRLVPDHALGSYSATLVRSIATSAKYADLNMQDQGGSGALFDFLGHALDNKEVPSQVYVRLAGFMKSLWAGLGKEGAHNWFRIIEELTSQDYPIESIETYAIISTRNLDDSIRSWADIEPGKKPRGAINPKAIQELIDEMYTNKKMRGREAYFLELSLSSGAAVARDFIDKTIKTPLDTFLVLYGIRNACMKKADPRKDELIAAKLAKFANQIDSLEDKIQEEMAMHADSIIKVDSQDTDRIDFINRAADSIKNTEKLRAALEYADKFVTAWHYDAGLLENYVNYAIQQANKAYDFRNYQEVLYQIYMQEKKKEKREDKLFTQISKRLDNLFYTSVIHEEDILATGKAFIDQKLHLSENRSQSLIDFLEDYRKLLDVTHKRSRFAKIFVDSIISSERSQYKQFLSDITKALSVFAGSFSEEKFKAWENMLAERFTQTDRVNVPSFILESAGSIAGASTEMIEDILHLKEFLKDSYQIDRKRKTRYNFMPEEFINTELVFLNAKKAAGSRIEKKAFFNLFEFCCDYYSVVRPTLLHTSTTKKNLDDLYSILELFAQVPAKEQGFYIDRAKKILESHAGKVETILRLQQDAATQEVRSKLEAEWAIVRETLRKVIFNYCRNIPEMIRKLGPDTAKKWTDAGLAPKTLNEAAKYFSQRSYTSELSRDKLLKGLKYEDVVSSLQTYAEALSDRRLSFDKTDSVEIASSINEGKIILPMTINAFGNNREKNYSIYKILTSYQTAFLEFGTYHIDEELARRLMKRNTKKLPDKITLAHLMKSYANVDAAAYIFTLLETARIKSRLLKEYPGLRKDMSVFEDYIRSRLPDSAEDINENEIPMAILYQACILGKPELNLDGREKKLENAITSEIEKILLPEATVNDTLELSDRLYSLLNIETDNFVASEPPIANINLEEAVAGEGQGGLRREDETVDIQTGPYLPFPEWDLNIGRLKANFVSVYEKPVEIVDGDDFVSRVLQEDRQDLQRIRRQFEALKPEEYVTLKKQLSGDIDFDRVVEAKAMMNIGVTPDDKLFMRKYKNQRSVATLFLTDLSGSLRKFLDLDNPTTRLIDIHKKTCLYMCEALENIGDAYAIYGYSGKTRQKVDAYLIKAFDEEYNGSTHQRISSLRPLQQNRDGAGIRYSTHVLSKRPEKTKIMVYLLEGAPHDLGYKDDYAIADTREALREARNAGLHPVIIFIGNSDEEVVRKIGDGFRFAHVSDINDVPAKLPDIYRRLTT